MLNGTVNYYNVDAIEFLLNYGIDINGVSKNKYDESKESALDAAVCNYTVVRYLIQKGIDVDKFGLKVIKNVKEKYKCGTSSVISELITSKLT